MIASAIRGVVRNGRIEVEEPLDLPDGTPVAISRVEVDDDAPLPPEEIVHSRGDEEHRTVRTDPRIGKRTHGVGKETEPTRHRESRQGP